jgi:NitT/TauT family transport system permease protein
LSVSGQPWAAVSGLRSTLLVLVGIVLLWELAVRGLGLQPILLPAPSRIAAEIASAPLFYLRQSGDTLMTTLAGFVLAVVLGVGLAIGIVYSRLLERVIYTLLVALNSLPKVALAPLFVIWLGTGVEPKIAIAVMLAIFSIVVDMVLGLRSIDPDILAMAHVSRARPIAVLWKIRLPNALPTLFAGMKVGISFALVGAIVGEFVAGSNGLGTVILIAEGQFDTTRVFAALVMLGLLGTVLFYVIEFAESLLLPWHPSHRARHGKGRG